MDISSFRRRSLHNDPVSRSSELRDNGLRYQDCDYRNLLTQWNGETAVGAQSNAKVALTARWTGEYDIRSWKPTRVIG